MNRKMFFFLFAALLASAAHAQFEPLDKYADRKGCSLFYASRDVLQNTFGRLSSGKCVFERHMTKDLISLRVLTCVDAKQCKKLAREIRKIAETNHFTLVAGTNMSVNEETSIYTAGGPNSSLGSNNRCYLIATRSEKGMVCVAISGRIGTRDLIPFLRHYTAKSFMMD